MIGATQYTIPDFIYVGRHALSESFPSSTLARSEDANHESPAPTKISLFINCSSFALLTPGERVQHQLNSRQLGVS